MSLQEYKEPAYLCTVCGHVMRRAVGGRCVRCRSKNVDFYTDSKSPALHTRSREIAKLKPPSAPWWSALVAVALTFDFYCCIHMYYNSVHDQQNPPATASKIVPPSDGTGEIAPEDGSQTQQQPTVLGSASSTN